MVNKESILLFFKEKTIRPLGFREIVSLMRLSHSERRALKRLLREMVKDGQIVITRKGLYGPSEEMNLVTGYFDAHRDGYGFVVSEKPGERDIFIPSRRTLGAMDNDRVICRIENWHKREGRIIRILERANSRITGTLDVTKTACYVKPRNKAFAFDLYIAPKDRRGARHGDTIVAEIISYPADNRPPSGKVIKVLKRPEDPRSEVEAIIEEFNLPQRFQKNVHDDAKRLYQKMVHETKLKRKDLRNLLTVTIDGEHAKDFDDAISIKLFEHGYRLWIHIADVGFYVGWDSAIDKEARKRGTSIYFPHKVIPMLPKELSEDLCSLKPKVEKLALTVEMDFNRNGERLNARFYPSLIKSDERMTYTSVRKILIDQDTHERRRYDYLLQDFELMNELSNVLRSKRLTRGSLDFDLPEPEVLLDLQGRPEDIIQAERNMAHIIIEEFMITANEAVAEHLQSTGFPCLYRIHEEPDPMKLDEIIRFIKPIIKLRKKTLKPPDFSQLLIEMKGTPEEESINYIVLRSLKQARYSPINVGHFGLASKCYTHFTSPIRRYPDLVVHRILRKALLKRQISDKESKELEGLLHTMAFHSSRMERRADETEKKVVDAMRVWFMKDKVGKEYEGRVISVTPHGLKVRLRDFYVEGFIHVSYMTDDFYQYNERTLSLIGRNKGRVFNLGKEVKARINTVDMEEREIMFGLS